ncbi:MAG TPA: hypothetical protein VH593_18600, partial [Ktedonobacteraceae bacterium]
PEKKQALRRNHLQIATGALLGAIPLLVMLSFAVIALFTNDTAYKALTNAAPYGFLYTSPVVLLIAVICLFLKRRRWISLALPMWVLTIPSAFVLMIMLSL